MKAYFAAAAAIALSSCATPPHKIQAAAIPAGTYSTLDCAALNAEQEKLTQEIAALSKLQNEAATGDAVGVFLVGVPLSSAMGGDKETEISVAKGKAQAVASERIAKGC